MTSTPERWVRKLNETSGVWEYVEVATPTPAQVEEIRKRKTPIPLAITQNEIIRRLVQAEVDVEALLAHLQSQPQAPVGMAAPTLADYVDQRLSITETQKETLLSVHDLIKHGYKFINLHIRKDGREYHFEADWLRQLLCSLDAAPQTPKKD